MMALAGALFLLAAAAPERWRFEVGEAPGVSVDNPFGSIAVEAGRAGEVVLEARAPGGRCRWTYEVRKTPEGVSARAVCAAGRLERCARARVDWIVRVPPSSALDLQGVDSIITVAGVRGDIFAGTIGGDVDVSAARGAVSASTLSGEVRVDGGSSAEVDTLSGNVTVARVDGPVRIKTASGNSVVDARGRSPWLDYRAEAGELRWSGICASGCRLQASSRRGEMRFRLREGSSFRVALQEGDLHDGVGLSAATHRGGVLRASYGAGDGELRLRSSRGAVWLSR